MSATSSHASETTHSPDSPGVFFMPPTMFTITLVVGGLLEAFWPQPIPLLPQWAALLFGGTLAGGGFVFMMVGHRQFVRAKTNICTWQPATTIVATGAYAISRNPMYVGANVLYLGIAVAAGSLGMLLAWPILLVYIAGYVVPREEAYLLRAFGQAYRDYQRTVRRWL